MAIDLDVHGNTKPLEAAVQAAINRIRRQPIKITVDDKGATQPLGNMKRAADEFSKSMEAANARILAFGASMAIINGVADAFKGMVRNLVEVEKSLADINVVMGLSTQNLDKFGDGLFKVAKETGAAFRVAADAATEYARQGLAVEETLKRTRDALVLTRLTGMDSAEAVKSLTAAMNTYGNQIKDTTQLVSKFAAVDVQFAVSAEDFAAAISRTGQAAKSAGVNIDELIGIVTSAQQQTARGGAVIGNALKTIFTKTGRTDTLNQLENLGIAVRDLEGNTIGAKRILSDLANTFDTLSEAQKAQITQTMGGLFHINILKAVLSDAAKQNGILANATQISANATDEAIQKNEQLRQTMDAMASETGNAIKQLSVQIGELMLAPGMEKILNTVKSLAEGASDILGDGESAGNQFANGFLKGLGNVITGPGLVVLTTVFVKLFMTAAKFTKESLSSLIGVTSEAQKQKAIQTSLVALIGQNAALGKEMLRTDISRTEKEKILLGLLKMQTAEAENLNRVSQKLASTLYTKGYGPGLTQGKRRAYGHIPNFADPERAQAAKGGYAAGSIRTMNMPGEGSVIYNSAETVKNFAGFKQPAIMPPQSSKAGKNYQQAFGSIHGFDPYAAGGYIPNYARKDTIETFLGTQSFRMLAASPGGTMLPVAGSLKQLNKAQRSRATEAYESLMSYVDKSNANLAPKALISAYRGSTVQEDPKKSLAAMLVPPEGYKKPFGTYKDLTWPVYGLRPDAQTDPSLSEMVKTNFKETGSEYANKIASIFNKAKQKIDGGTIWSRMEKTAGAMGAWQAAVGSLFETAVATALDYQADKRGNEQGDFDVRAGNKKILSEAFDGFPENMLLADFKNDSESYGNKKSFYKKVMKEKRFEKMQNKNKLISKRKAYGHIPNFADPLSDAIGREKAAGVPVSQIRVGSHSALMSKGNPLGLGVTNTYDEPNGLRDVFGANGFVPNYASQDFNENWFIGSSASQRKKLAEILREKIKTGNLVIKSEKELAQIISQINPDIKLHGRGIRKANQLIEVSNSTISSNNSIRKTLGTRLTNASSSIKSGYGSITGGFSAMNKKFEGTAIGRSLSGGGGMGLMVGAPMLAGMLQQGGAAEGGFGYKAGGALMGAGTGASMGMIFGPIGIAVGGVVGAINGWTNAVEESEKAIKAEKDARIAQESAAAVSMAGIFAQGLSGKTSGLTSGIMGQGFLGGIMSDKSLADTIKRLKDGTKNLGTMFEDKELHAQMKKEALNQERLTEDIFGNPVNLKYSEKEMQETIQNRYRNAKISVLRAAIDPEKEYTVGDDIKDMFGGESVVKGSEIMNKLISQKGEAFNKLFDTVANELEKLGLEYKNQRKAVILQLNIQKAMIAAQQAAAMEQLDIKDRYNTQANILDAQQKLMGSLMSEQQKAQIKYTKSINKAAEAFESAKASADSGLKLGVLSAVKSSDPMQSAIKASLAKQGIQLKEDDEGKVIADLTDKLANMDTSKVVALVEELQKIPGLEILASKLLDEQTQKRQNSLDIAQKQKEMSEAQALSELKINQTLANREQLIKNLERDKRMSAEGLRSSQKIRGIDARVASAERLAGIGPGYQTREQQEAFQIEEKRFTMEEKIKTLEENRTQALKDQAIEKAKIEPTDQAEARLQELKTMQEAFGANPFDMQEMESLQKSIDERSKKLEEIEQKTKNINTETEKEIAAEKELLAIEEKRLRAIRERQTGPGAFRSGISDGMAKVREQVEYMDYELAEKIPGAFADGLANAMSEGLSGAKSIGDALRDSAINFLQMIQQAMMKKAAYSLVGAMGFSRGGNVRKYSNGGGVPAMVSNGEYVMGRDAVNKYGGAFMHGLNAGGSVPGFSNGGKLEGFQYKSGRAYQSKKMSGAFYARGENVGLKEDESAIEGALQEKRRKEEEAVQKAKEKAARRNARVNQIIGIIGSVAAAGLISGAGSWAKEKGLFGKAAQADAIFDKYGVKNPDMNNPFDIAQMRGDTYVGHDWSFAKRFFKAPQNLFKKRNEGGYISGAPGIDQIPAMLSEGEYVIRASSARQLGRPMLDRINAGKFNDGGPIEKLADNSETSGSGGNTNNINISVNIEGGSVKGENKSSDRGSVDVAAGSANQEGSLALADKIKQQVLSVIVEEQRPGGLLSD